jgi:hypothetical protein
MPHKENADGSMGVWEDVVSNNFHTQYLTEDELMYIEFSPDQKQYLNDIAPSFMDPTMTTMDIMHTMMILRIRHYDPVNNVEQFDTFELWIEGSGETKSQLCGYEVLEVEEDTRFWYDRKYMVGPVAGAEEKYDGWTKRILIDTIVNSPEDFDKECNAKIFRTLERKRPSEEWEQIWNERKPK